MYTTRTVITPEGLLFPQRLNFCSQRWDYFTKEPQADETEGKIVAFNNEYDITSFLGHNAGAGWRQYYKGEVSLPGPQQEEYEIQQVPPTRPRILLSGRYI